MKAYIYLAMLPLAVSCIGANKMQEEFVETSPEECLVIDGKTIFTFEPDKCQESYSPERHEFRIGDDSMSNYYAFKAGHGRPELDYGCGRALQAWNGIQNCQEQGRTALAMVPQDTYRTGGQGNRIDTKIMKPHSLSTAGTAPENVY